MEGATDETLWRAEVLAPLRATVACMEGRLQEQEASLGRASREAEHAAAKQRRAERLAAESAERCEYLERKLDVAKRDADAAVVQIDRLQAAESQAAAERDALATVKEQLLLLARSHREQEELVSAAASREAELSEQLREAERGRAANEQAAAAAAAAEERHALELGALRAQVAHVEEQAAEASVRLEASRREVEERVLRSHERADALQVAHDTMRQQLEEQAATVAEQAAAVESLREALRLRDAALLEHVTTEEELRRRLARADAEATLLKEAHAQAMADVRVEQEVSAAALAERHGDVERLESKVREQAQALDQRRAQLQKTVALGAQLTGIQQMLEELGTLDAAA